MDTLQLRNFKDFLQTFNQMSEGCFLRCVDNLNSRELSKEESDCVEICAKKHINVNHKVMGVYMEVQSEMVNKKIAEAERQQLADEQKLQIQANAQPISSESVATADAIPSEDNVTLHKSEETNNTRTEYLTTTK